MTTGWNCPRCGKAHGPHVDTCQEVISEHKFRIGSATLIGVRDGPKKMENPTPKVSDGGVVTNKEGVRVKRRLREPRFKTVEDAIKELRKYILYTFTGEEPSTVEVLENAVRKLESVEKLERENSALRRDLAMSGGII